MSTPAPKPMPKSMSKSGTDLSVRFCGIELKNPLIAASGTFGYGLEFEDVVQIDKLGGFVVKGLSREPIPGNPPPRLFETAAGMLNAIGLQNVGAGTLIGEKPPKLRGKKKIPVFPNLFRHTPSDYPRTLQILDEGEGIGHPQLHF